MKERKEERGMTGIISYAGVSSLEDTRRYSARKLFIKILMAYIFMNSFGFPGRYTEIFGDMFGKLVEYSSFFLQILLMILMSGDNFFDLKLIDMKPKYGWLYFFLAVLFAQSMVATSDASEQLISCVRVTVTGLYAIWICEKYGVEEFLEIAVTAQVGFIAASLLFPILFPSAYYFRAASYENAFIGIANSKNAAASELAVGIVLQTILLRIKMDKKRKLSWWFMAVLALQSVLLFLTNGKGALVTCIGIGWYVLFFERKNKIRLPLGVIFILGSVGFIVFALTIIPAIEPVLNLIGKDATLTGRVPLWNQIVDVMSHNHTWLGYGYSMFWRDEDAVALVHAGFNENSFLGTMTVGSHNVLLELWCNDGLIGVIAFFITMLGSFSNIRKMKPEYYTYTSAYLIFYMLRGWTERGWPTYEHNLLFLLICLGMAGAGKYSREGGENNAEKLHSNSHCDDLQEELEQH